MWLKAIVSQVQRSPLLRWSFIAATMFAGGLAAANGSAARLPMQHKCAVLSSQTIATMAGGIAVNQQHCIDVMRPEKGEYLVYHYAIRYSPSALVQ